MVDADKRRAYAEMDAAAAAKKLASKMPSGDLAQIQQSLKTARKVRNYVVPILLGISGFLCKAFLPAGIALAVVSGIIFLIAHCRIKYLEQKQADLLNLS